MKSKLFLLASLCLALTACEQHVTHKDGTTRETRPGTATDQNAAGRGAVNPNNPNYNADSANRSMRNE